MDAESLIRTLRTYDASFDAAAVRAAFSGPDSADLVRWAALHVTPDTLLSPDELNQYAALEESGLTERLAMSPDLAEARVLSDQEIGAAIEELNRSTQAITRHTETLRQQQEAFDRLVDGARQSHKGRAVVEAEQARKWETKRRDLSSTTDELSQSLGSRALELEQNNTRARESIHQTVNTMLRSDDKLLTSLQKLGWELETEDKTEQQDVVTLRETCARLIKFTVECVRTKLDRIYLESLEVSAQSVTTDRVSPDEVSALQEELESLYAEILPVAQMSAEQQFLEPALKSLGAKNGRSLAKSAQATSYIHDCLDYLIDRAHDLMARLEAFQAYQAAAGAVLDIAKSELASPVPAEPIPRRPPVGASPSRDAFQSPARPQPKNHPGYTYSAAGIGKEHPLEEILRTLAISLPKDGDSEAADARVQVGELASILSSRRAKLDDVARNVQETFESATVRHVADTKLAIQLVRDSVLAESPFGEVRLVDPEIEGSIDVLAQELANVEVKLREADAGLAGVRGRNAKRDELISRWGS
ncbi:hypothetical protein VTK26DRAFT_6909 [Humicola hyalothermophila]